MKTLINQTKMLIERTANNCDYYKREGMTEHLINEVGCLRGIMYVADEIGIEYPFQLYYKLYIESVHNELSEKEPSPAYQKYLEKKAKEEAEKSSESVPETQVS